MTKNKLSLIFGIVLMCNSSFGIFCSTSNLAERPDSFKNIKNQQEETIFTVAEKMPQFPGGQKKLLEFIDQNLEYPSQTKMVKGRVFMKLIIEKDGSISAIELLKGLGSYFDSEAIRLIKLMPKWTPAYQTHRVVRCYYMMTIEFK